MMAFSGTKKSNRVSGNRSDASCAATPFFLEMPAFDLARTKRPATFVGIPTEFLVLIGHCVAGWSLFERDFDKVLGALLLSSPNPPDTWHLLSFAKRKNLMLKELARHFVSRHGLLSFFEKLMIDAKQLHTKRNLLVHGKIFFRISTGEIRDNSIPGEISLHCVGFESKRTVSVDFTKEDLDSMRYELAHLCGRIGAISSGANLERLSLSIHDRRAVRGLQQYLQKLSPQPGDVPNTESAGWIRQKLVTRGVT